MKNFQPKDLLFFNKMITPTIMTIAYWVLCAGVLIQGIRFMRYNVGYGIFMIVVGIVAIRVTCEALLIFFKIGENTKKIADATDKNNK